MMKPRVRPPTKMVAPARYWLLALFVILLITFIFTRHLNSSLAIDDEEQAASCPDYFGWIFKDLLPWRESGITRDMVMGGRGKANFRLVIVDGKAYVESFNKSFESRDNFTLWGISQLLRRYPGKVPDLDLMFDCSDMPVISPRFPAPPPLFRYCSNDSMSEIVFPDWSFWGWQETNVKPWEALSKELQEGNKRIPWREREPYAYWKGTPSVTYSSRWDLLNCNLSDQHDWGARLYSQDWSKERKERFKQSNLASQCIHRYKIYIEGRSWSVSNKYILACDSMALFINPKYYDFFSRSLMPLKHYWPIKRDDKCRSIKYAVEWGNTHQQEAEAIGKAGTNFILNQLKMDYVYDYMLHLLTEYAKLLTYKPIVPKEAVELRTESIARGIEKKYMIDSMVKGPALSNPCTMPPPDDSSYFNYVIERQEKGTKQVDMWENEYWRRQ